MVSPPSAASVQKPVSPIIGMILPYGTVFLFALALISRLPHLSILMDRDGYDEGVYIQSLRAMREFFLYSDIFYSQPPLFLSALYPFFNVFGGTVFAARLAVGVYAVAGFIGAALMGQAISGRAGGWAALALLLTDALYFQASTSVQAEALCINFLLLSLGAGLQWWRRPLGARGFAFASLAGIALACSVFSKLFGVVGAIPLLLLAFSRFRHRYRDADSKSGADTGPAVFPLLSLLAALTGFLIAVALILTPFRDRFPALIADNVGLHVTDQHSVFLPYLSNLLPLTKTLLRCPLFYLALIGAFVAGRRRDPLLGPAVAGVIAAFYILWRQFPLFYHHQVTLTPFLLFLALLYLRPATDLPASKREDAAKLPLSRSALGILLVVTLLQIVTTLNRLRQESIRYAATQELSQRAAHDLARLLKPQDWVITDGQFVAAAAGRSTPPGFVDTSAVRIDAGMLSSAPLIAAAQQQRCRAVLFFSDRLNNPRLTEFHGFISGNFTQVKRYNPNKTLWIKK